MTYWTRLNPNMVQDDLLPPPFYNSAEMYEGKGDNPMTIQEMGPGKLEVRVTVSAKVIVDQDDLVPLRNQGWDDTLRHLHQKGISISKRVDVLTKGGD